MSKNHTVGGSYTEEPFYLKMNHLILMKEEMNRIVSLQEVK